MNYPDSVQFLYSLGNEIRTFKPGLQAMEVLLKALGDPHLAPRVVHVAGTNGKGSTCAMIEAGLRAAGLRTGLYTSPHLVSPNERIRINGEPVSEAEFADAFNHVHRIAEQLILDGNLEHHPTYFETVTAMGFHIFRGQGVHTAVVEVGLGGRLDSTNLVRPAVCVITPVDFDHEAYLGSSIDKIAFEKAGILKSGAVAVNAPQREDVARTIDQKIRETGIATAPEVTPEMITIDRFGSEFQAGDYRIRCPLAGEHQVLNAVTAVRALRALGLGRSEVEKGIAQTAWPGRLERVRRSPDVILDGAHNPAGVRALAAYIRRFLAGHRLWMIYGTMRDKSIAEIAETLFPLARRLILTAPDTPRAIRPEALRDFAPHADTAPDLKAALEIASAAGPEDVILIAGSLYLVGEARELLVK